MKPKVTQRSLPFRWHGCWEWNKRNAVARCRWFVAYVQLAPGVFLGVASGYSGGAGFEFEEFFVRLKDGKIANCVMDGLDRAMGKPSKFDTVLRPYRRIASQSPDLYELFCEFNYGWNYDVQYLNADTIVKYHLIAGDEDPEFPGEFTLKGGTSSASWVKSLLDEHFWVTASPRVMRPRMSTKEKAARRVRAMAVIPRMKAKEKKLMRLWES